jgi:hypothetical protein
VSGRPILAAHADDISAGRQFGQNCRLDIVERSPKHPEGRGDVVGVLGVLPVSVSTNQRQGLVCVATENPDPGIRYDIALETTLRDTRPEAVHQDLSGFI